MTIGKINKVHALFLRCLDASLELGRHIDRADVCMGDLECEPYYAVQMIDGTMMVVEGDYARCTVRARTLDGRIGVEVTAHAPLALGLEVFLSWARAHEWSPDDARRGAHDRDDEPATRPGPLGGLPKFLGGMVVAVLSVAHVAADFIEPIGLAVGA